MSIALVCYIIAAILFALNAIMPARWNAISVGLFFFVLGHVLAGVEFKSV